MTSPMLPQALETPQAAQYEKQIQGKLGAGEDERRALMAQYGADFPLAQSSKQVRPGAWASWAKGRFDKYSEGKSEVLHYSSRNRTFAEGRHWVSSRGVGSQWKEPPGPSGQVRAVFDMTGPALDYRLQVLVENRPGFRFTPSNMDPDRQRKAESRQRFVEYQWHAQRMQSVLREAGFWAQRDGVSFMMVYWKPDAGQEDDDGPLGDVGTCVYRMDQVAVSPDATATHEPSVWTIKETIPKAEAVASYGIDVLDVGDADWEEMSNFSTSNGDDIISPLLSNTDTVSRIITFLRPNQYFPQGLVVVTVGEKTVYGPAPLPFRTVPMVRMTDGNMSPLFFPPANMNRWVPVQMRMNMLISKWVENVRRNAGGQLLGKPGSIATETLQSGNTPYIEVRSWQNIQEAVQQLDGFSIGNDVKELLDREKQQFENLSGWNDAARGSFSDDQSGRAILAISEQLTKAIAPFVNAGADAMSQWAKLNVLWGRWGYTVPRAIGVIGGARPDLAKEITQDDLEGVADVYVDPETMTVRPFALQMYILDDYFQKGIIDIAELRERSPFGWTKDFSSPDIVQEAKAKRLCESFRSMMPPEPMIWQDDENIQQTVIEKDILLAPNIEQPVFDAALQRWNELANQAMMKQGAQPVQGGAAPGGGQPPHKGGSLPPAQQPMLGLSPSMAAAPVAVQTGQADKNFAAQLAQ